MIEIQAIADGVGPIDPVIPRVENRRERSHQKTPFPPLPGEKEEEEPEAPADPDPQQKQKDEDPDHQIDIHVHGLILPTRQLLPPAGAARTLH